MTFAEAADFEMPFGKYKGQTLDQISTDDQGLKYLDWLYGEADDTESHWYEALDAYLNDPTIKRELERL